jgi:hypothetical protein
MTHVTAISMLARYCIACFNFGFRPKLDLEWITAQSGERPPPIQSRRWEINFPLAWFYSRAEALMPTLRDLFDCYSFKFCGTPIVSPWHFHFSDLTLLNVYLIRRNPELNWEPFDQSVFTTISNSSMNLGAAL